MKYFIDKYSKKSAYMQLYEQLRHDIRHGVYPADRKLPSKRLIAAETGVSVITVEHAYALLLDGGYAVSRERSGYFPVCTTPTPTPVRRAAIDEMSASDIAGEDFPFSAYFKTMRHVMTFYGEKILNKSPGTGCIELREAVAAYLSRSRGIFVSAEQIVIGSGAEYLYTLILQLLGRDRPFGLEAPCYEKIRQVYEAGGCCCEMLKMGDDGIKSEALAAFFGQVLHVTPYHSYPSGVTATAAKRQEYAKWAEERDAFIVEDDYDSELSASPLQFENIVSIAPRRTILVNTFTKTLAPAIRMGYMVLPERLAEEFRRRLGFYSCTVPVFDQLVLSEFINNGDFERYINRRKRRLI